MSEHELVLVLDARVDEIAEQAPLDAIMGLRRIIDGTVWQATTDKPVRVIAAAGLVLPRDRLASRVDAAHVGADWATQAPGIARSIRVDVFEIVKLLRGKSTRWAVAFRGQGKRHAIAPPAAHLGGEQFGIDFVLVRLKKLFEPDNVSLDHLEDGEAAVQPELSRLRHQIVLCVVPQHEQPWFARLLVIRRISLGATVNGGHADTVGVAEVNPERRDWLAVPDFHQRHPVGSPDLPKGTAFDKQRGKAVAIGCHGLGIQGVQRDQDVIAAGSEPTDPVLRVTLPGIAYQFGAFGRAGDKRTERLE